MAFVSHSPAGLGLHRAGALAPARSAQRPERSTPRASGSTSRRAALAGLAGAASALALSALPRPALADRTFISAKRAYERYYPRISAGGETLKAVGASLAADRADEAAAAVSDPLFDVKFRRALGIYATSFSDSSVSQQSRDLVRCADRLFDQLGLMVAAADADGKMERYSLAVEAYQKYVKIARLPKEAAMGFVDAKPIPVAE